MRKKLGITILLSLAAVFIISCSKESQPIETTKTVIESTESIQKGFTEFEATDIDGNAVDQSIFADSKLTMINIWGTFCSPCLKEMPDLGQLAAEYKDKDFQVVGIVIDVLDSDGSILESQVEKAKKIVSETEANYLHLLPSNDLITAKLAEVSAIPETVFVDEDGNLVGEPLLGAKSKKDWITIIEERLKEVE